MNFWNNFTIDGNLESEKNSREYPPEQTQA